MGVLRAKVLEPDGGFRWEEVFTPIGSEVFVGSTDPYDIDALATDELWQDTSGGAPGVLKARVGGQWQEVIRYGTSAAYEKQYGQDAFGGNLDVAARADHSHGTPSQEVEIGDTEPTDDSKLWLDTTTDPSVLKAKVDGAWVEVSSATDPTAIPDEVWIGATPPTDVNTDLWYDLTTLQAKVDGRWVPITSEVTPQPIPDEVWVQVTPPTDVNTELWYDPSATGVVYTSEVSVGATDPYGDPNAIDELWFNTVEHQLMARTSSGWEHAVGREVWVDDEDPYTRLEDPAVNEEAELWFDTTVGMLKVRHNAAWVDVTTGEHEVAISTNDPASADPLTELWYTPTQTPPVNPPALWDASITYPIGEYCFWPDAMTQYYQANRATLGEEPGTVTPDPWDMVQAPPSTAAPGILRARVNGNWEDVASGGGTDEVWLGIDPPTDPTTELWYDGDAVGPPIMTTTGALKVRDPADLTGATWLTLGTPVPGPEGPVGPEGPQGPTGVSTVIVGDFGAVTTPADLPPDGLIPVDWDGLGNPAAPLQMVQGWALYYDKPADPLDGHLFQFVTTGIDPVGWIDIGLIQGPAGPTGPAGPIGLMTNEVHIGPDTPTIPEAEMWFDTDDTRLLGPFDLPPDGATYSVLTKETDLDGDVHWRDPYSVPSGKVIQFPNAEGVKLNLYSTTFGLGITASTLNLFGSIIAFKKDGINGEQFASIDTSGVHVWGDHFKAETDGMGLKMQGGAHIYKQTGGGLVLRKAANTTEVIVENEDGTNRRNVATKPDSEATVAHNATNMDEVRAGQNYILYNDSIVCWYVSLTPKALVEGAWQEVIPPNGYPDFLRPARLIETWKSAPNGTHNATSIAIGLQIEANGKVSLWKPADGPDIEGTTVINIDFVYPRNY